jgi:hypothetical protein
MSVLELQVLHSRYASLSHRFRAAWAFHQYLESLRKVFMEGDRFQVPVDFQELYADLKAISQRLTATEASQVRGELDTVESRLARLIAALVEEDNKVQPHQMRQFFGRVKSQDEGILTQLVKFYLYAEPVEAWPADRHDKVDFVLTRVGEERRADGSFTLIERGRLREIGSGLGSLVAAETADPAENAAAVAAIEGLKAEVDACQSLDELNDRQLVPRYRTIKRTLGSRLYQPELLVAVIETNLTLKNLIQQLTRLEERRIVAEYERIFELEREVAFDRELDGELGRFRETVERFEQRLQREDLKLADLAEVRQHVRSLLERLETRGQTEAEFGAGVPVAPPIVADVHPNPLDEPLHRLETALEASDPSLTPRQVTLTREVYSLRLEPREVLAFRRLRSSETGADLEYERLILESAAVRVRLNDEVEEIKGLLDDSAVTGDAPIFGRCRRTVRLAGVYLARLGAAMEDAVAAGRLGESQDLLVLRMRLLRDYAGGWLLAERPYLPRLE